MTISVRDLVPPALLELYRRVRGFHGTFENFASWDEAMKASTGYDSPLIVAKVREAMRKVRYGEAAYERDSVLFEEIRYSWPLLAGLLWIATQTGNRLNIVDFGGSLGSSYYQNRKFLSDLAELRWNVVEQRRFVECGKREFEDGHLKFYEDLDECFREQGSDAILFSSSLQYLEKPYAVLEKVLSLGFRFLLFDRTPLIDRGEDRVTVQKVPPSIYNASYPAWFFSRGKFLSFLSGEFQLVAEFEALSGTFYLRGGRATDTGLIFRRKKDPDTKTARC